MLPLGTRIPGVVASPCRQGAIDVTCGSRNSWDYDVSIAGELLWIPVVLPNPTWRNRTSCDCHVSMLAPVNCV